jgi:hypothetical protein
MKMSGVSGNYSYSGSNATGTESIGFSFRAAESSDSELPGGLEAEEEVNDIYEGTATKDNGEKSKKGTHNIKQFHDGTLILFQ